MSEDRARPRSPRVPRHRPRADGWLRARARNGTAGPPGTIDLGDLALPIGRTLTSILRNRDGAPVPRALVTLELPDAAGSREFRSDQTDDLGRFIFPGLTPGKHVLVWGESLFRDSWRAARDVLVRGRRRWRADLRPDPADRLVVRVVDAAGSRSRACACCRARAAARRLRPDGGRRPRRDRGGRSLVTTSWWSPPEAGARAPSPASSRVLDVAGRGGDGGAHGAGRHRARRPDAPGRSRFRSPHVTVVEDGRTISDRTDETGEVELGIPVGTVVDVDVEMLVDARGPGTERGHDAFQVSLAGLRSPAWDRRSRSAGGAEPDRRDPGPRSMENRSEATSGRRRRRMVLGPGRV